MITLKISRLVSIERWWLQGLILKANNKSEETSGDGPSPPMMKLVNLYFSVGRESFSGKLKMSQSRNISLLTSSSEDLWPVPTGLLWLIVCFQDWTLQPPAFDTHQPTDFRKNHQYLLKKIQILKQSNENHILCKKKKKKEPPTRHYEVVDYMPLIINKTQGNGMELNCW